MSYPSRTERFKQFIEKLRVHPPASSREDAVSLMKRLMKEVEDSNQLPPDNYGDRMNVFSLETGWSDLRCDPCYWNDANTAKHRTYVYNNGRIVIERIKVGEEGLILDKPGA